MINAKYLEKAHYWAETRCFDELTRTEVQDLLKEDKQEELEERFSTELEFGTGGLRGLVGAGTARLNAYTVRRATTALSLYLKSFDPQIRNLKVAISFDSRVSSKEFSEVTAGVLAQHGITVYLTKELRPTPALSFMVRHFSCHAGICITASHNPPQYNGYKVYWQDGGQIVRPHDKKIIQVYQGLSDYSLIEALPFAEALDKGLVHYCDEEVDYHYREMAKKVSYRKITNRSQKIVYSALHGAGGTLLPVVLGDRGYKNIFLVPQQKDPDGLFPTVNSPNPEDEESLKLAKAYADEKGACLAMATDPDADRLGVCVKEEGEWVNLNGNQIAVLLTDYILGALKEKGEDFSKAYIVKTVVTTDLLEKIASTYGCKTYETLTGFKWIADVILREEKEGHQFLCGGEESLGFLAQDHVRDKDAVTTGALMCELYSYCEEQGMSLLGYLDRIYDHTGFYCESLKTLTLSGLSGRKKINEIMAYFRDLKQKQVFSESLSQKLDYSKQTKTIFADELSQEPFCSFPQSDVIQLKFESGLGVTVRPSGTEAKIKFYFTHKEASVSTESLHLRKKKIQKELKYFETTLMSEITQKL